MRTLRQGGKVLADRLDRALLELGGNNGILVMDDADLALRAVVFAAVGTFNRCSPGTISVASPDKLAAARMSLDGMDRRVYGRGCYLFRISLAALDSVICGG